MSMRHKIVIAALAALAVPGTGAVPAAHAQTGFTPPPVGPVWLMNIENLSYGSTFGLGGPTSPAPFMSNDLPREGALLPQFYATGHNSLDNYTAQISGQAPTPSMQDDCDTGYNDNNGAGFAAFGQWAGQGCIYPAQVKTLADQLTDRG